jgi:hypothetical protein
LNLAVDSSTSFLPLLDPEPSLSSPSKTVASEAAFYLQPTT